MGDSTRESDSASLLGPTTGSMLQTRLPMNRKERYFTGTVLPMLIASDGFTRLHRFLGLCGVTGVESGRLDLDGPPSLQFFTEYSFAESVVTEVDRVRFADRPLEADTPDLVLVGSDWLLAVEAKMFHRPTRQALLAQMRRQRVVVDYWAAKFGLAPERVGHVLLLPEGLEKDRVNLSVPVVTWEQVLASYADDAPRFWVDVLRVALAGYEAMASPEPTFGSNADAKLTGEEIIAEKSEFAWMGRGGGLKGTKLADDIDSGTWRSRSYEVRRAALPENPNWFPIAEFVAKVLKAQGGEEVVTRHTPFRSSGKTGTVSLHAAEGRYLDATVESDGSVVLRGQDLSGPREYEYAFIVAPHDVTRLITALGAVLDSDESLLDVLTLYGPSIPSPGEGRWLERNGVPSTFWNRFE